MILAGLTGGIGAGKSVVGEMFVSAGFSLVDTDIIAREVVSKGSPGLDQVVNVFGSDILDAKGEINRPKLAQIVFGNPSKRILLESILHPIIRETWQERVKVESKGRHQGIIVAIPLLYETGAQELFGKVVCVGCSIGKQRLRLEARGWSDEEINQRIGAQWSTARKLDKANYVIWNDYSLAVCRDQVEKLISSLGKK